MMGVMPLARALAIARERDLDLVEVSPNAIPPVCKLLNYGRYKYQQAKKENETRKNQKTVTLKEIRLRPRTDDHDIGVKLRKIQEFLAEGDKVRVSVQFRGPDMRHPEIGRKLLDDIAENLKGIATIERTPIMEGRMMSMVVSRAPGWEPPKKQSAPSATTKPSQEASAPQPEDDGSSSNVAETLDTDTLSAESAPAAFQSTSPPIAAGNSSQHNGHSHAAEEAPDLSSAVSNSSEPVGQESPA